ncbi:hypothetical protein Q5113_11970 [Acinetobacter pittii]|uniref:hypothetical protein n=1 Tax=Acinetobacter pittii TaxID=48296 RepID=UPI0027086E13|nr:hypothetical protein [Acinetobacter pittii]MDO7536270.1 hypothetical protein [Acinetobacter pittii]
MQHEELKSKPKFSGMIVFTVAYIILIIMYVIFDYEDMKILKPNEWGDFFAGFFAPLAFMWLIFGYYQQGQELKLQAIELSNLVKEQKEQNKIYKDQIEEKRIESKPILEFKDASYKYTIGNYEDEEGTIFNFHILNHGKIAKDIVITAPHFTRRIHKLDTDIKTSIRFYDDEIEKELYRFQGKPFSIELDISYCDNSGYYYYSRIKLFTDDFIAGAADMNVNLRIQKLT